MEMKWEERFIQKSHGGWNDPEVAFILNNATLGLSKLAVTIPLSLSVSFVSLN